MTSSYNITLYSVGLSRSNCLS